MESTNGSPERMNRWWSASEKELVAMAMEEQPEPLLCAAVAWTRAPTSPQACTGSSASRAPPIPRWPAWPPPGFAHASLAPCARRSPTAGPRRREPLPLLHALCAAPGPPPRVLPGPRAPLGPRPYSTSRAHAACCCPARAPRGVPPEVVRAQQDAGAAGSRRGTRGGQAGAEQRGCGGGTVQEQRRR